MSDLLTTSNVTFVLGILGTIFGVYLYFKKPQDELELRQFGTEKDISNKASILAQKEMENKAALLDQQVKLERDLNEKKFTEFGTRLDAAFALAQNHIHTVSTQVENLTSNINSLTLRVERLTVILEERLPRKDI